MLLGRSCSELTHIYLKVMNNGTEYLFWLWYCMCVVIYDVSSCACAMFNVSIGENNESCMCTYDTLRITEHTSPNTLTI